MVKANKINLESSKRNMPWAHTANASLGTRPRHTSSLRFMQKGVGARSGETRL